MIRKIKKYGGKLFINNSVEGERIETKVERVVHNNEPIKDGAPIIFTDRRDGVKPETNIRTDRFEKAIDAMDTVAKSYKARRENKADMTVEKGGKNEAKKDVDNGADKGAKEGGA